MSQALQCKGIEAVYSTVCFAEGTEDDIRSLRSGFNILRKNNGFRRNFFYNTGEGEAEENRVSQPDKE